MATTPLPPAGQAALMAVGNPGGGASEGMPPPPGTDMTGICFRDQLWLNTYPLDRNLIFDYFALSPFYDWSCNNEQLRARSIHPLDISHLSKMTGTEYALSEVMEPNLFVIRKQKRDGPEKVNPMLTYYILDGSVYQAPQLSSVFAARIVSSSFILPLSDSNKFYLLQRGKLELNSLLWLQGRALYHISKAFNTAASKLEKIGYADAENEESSAELKSAKETIDLKELKRVDHILASLQRKLPPAPPPPPFPEGYAPSASDAEKGPDGQQASEQQPSVDPIIDQGPAKRMKFQ
ncbi:hypothetical protein C4D60_Mb05t24940 [Musa balbisiana]|uniref:Mediator of RNA polymerase II transcription subunit 6 n=1 Tax=Musa balbisiana TaxID=52838 RepID=A0A4S8JYQ6_MUSBA|nr:hypothetical protein C4D60_Mb05t24940 [Musa balbisiana]